jgi:two-component system sensor histidine kinase KdpD
VSHDLRSPLTAIKAAVGSLRSDEVEFTDADRRQLLAAIESQTDRLTGTVTDLLDMSRLEGGAVRPTIEPVEVRVLLQDVVVATKAAAGGRELCVNAPEGMWARADYGLLLQALTNLTENAVKYSTPGGAIQLRAHTDAGRVVLEVADEGPGISSADLPHIFERFYRGSEGKRVQGTGLGLAIARAMVELCGGHVAVESSPAGSTFRISLAPSGSPR